MRCPVCASTDSKVVDSRPYEEDTAIRRRRECLSCGHRFTTYERMGETPLVVVKADGSSEAYSREKLLRGLLIACAKRPISSDVIAGIVDSIELSLRDSLINEIPSKKLGEMALERLAGIDDVAYVRFASVYKDFQSIDEFTEALTDLKKG